MVLISVITWSLRSGTHILEFILEKITKWNKKLMLNQLFFFQNTVNHKNFLKKNKNINKNIFTFVLKKEINVHHLNLWKHLLILHIAFDFSLSSRWRHVFSWIITILCKLWIKEKSWYFNYVYTLFKRCACNLNVHGGWII